MTLSDLGRERDERRVGGEREREREREVSPGERVEERERERGREEAGKRSSVSGSDHAARRTSSRLECTSVSIVDEYLYIYANFLANAASLPSSSL